MKRRSSRTFPALFVAAVVCLGIPTGAAFAEPAVGPTGASSDPTAPTASIARTAAAADSKLPTVKVSAGNAYSYRGRQYVLPRTKLDLRAAVVADVVGQKLALEIYRNGTLVATGSFLRPSPLVPWVFGHHAYVNKHIDTLDGMLDDLPEGLLQGLETGPSLRPDRLEEARDRLFQ